MRSVVVRLSARAVHTEARIAELGLRLPAVNAPKGAYALTSRVGDLIFTAGHLPQPASGNLVVGVVGGEDGLSIDEGYNAAKLCALSLLATLKRELGDLDEIVRVVKLVGFVNCDASFSSQHLVMNGASDVIGEVLGAKRGTHARSAVGTNALPLGVPVEVELVVQVKPRA